MIERTLAPVLKNLSDAHSVVTVTGPRQSGKTTLCRSAFPDKAYVSLENLDAREFAQEDPRGFLKRYPDGAVLDEIQRTPDLLSYIQTLVDDDPRRGLFILTGSQQFEVASRISQSLAGRTALLRLLPLSLEELNGRVEGWSLDRHLLSGFYPRIHAEGLDPTRTLADYFETYVERDLRLLVNVHNLSLFQRFVKLCAGRVGQLLNLQSLANDAGVSHTTARSWLTLLEASYVVFLLQPFHRNLSKRLVKAPKLYFYDVGLACFLLGIESESHANRDPLRGNLVENLVVAEALKYRLHRGRRSNLNFYRDSAGNEVDLIVGYGPDVFPVEIKAGATITKDYFKGLSHLARALPDLRWPGGLLYGGDETMVRSGVRIRPLVRIHELLAEVKEEADAG